MKLQFFSRQMVKRLHATAKDNIHRYGNNELWLEDLAAGSQQWVHESQMVVDPPPILEMGGAMSDAINARRIFTWLNNLSPAIAMEERLWAYLTHCVFREYMKSRWPVDAERLIYRRYLFETHSFDALVRNGIARLWWGGKLTFDQSRLDPFELTDVLFLRQDIQVSLLERRIGKCRNVRVSVLEYLREHRSQLSESDFGKRIQVLLRELNLLGGLAVLDALPPEDIQSYLNQVAESFSSSAASTEVAAST